MTVAFYPFLMTDFFDALELLVSTLLIAVDADTKVNF